MISRVVQLTIFFAILLPVGVRAESGDLRWLGKRALSEMRSVEIDCGEGAYKFVTRHSQRSVELVVVEREPAKFSSSVEESIKSALGEFFLIDPLRFSCGAGPTDGNREGLMSQDRNRDFTGQLRIELTGFHRTGTQDAEENCAASGGVFDPKTTRILTVSRDTFDARPGVVGRCVSWSSDWDRRGEN